VKECKYRFVEDLARDMGSIIIERFGSTALPANTIIIPVPLHPKRLRWRGFNQAEIIAKTLGEHFKVELAPAMLYRTSLAKPQADILNRYERIKNIVGAFAVRDAEHVKNRSIILIDDVSTTGATLDACATALKSAGAKEVTAMVFARG
jgi:ComF family protein